MMPRRIRVLDRVTVNKIAAGEVVGSPSSVIKELVENSIDASARSITIYLDKGGIGRITVIDDGDGMSKEDAEVAFIRHSTSKISRIEDLNGLSTLGFRGEALASISAVANVELLTREKGSPDENGTRIVVSAGRILTMEDAGCPEGTRITVTDLFENVPARKKFLKSVQAEKAVCMDIVQRSMLVNHNIGFKMLVDGDDRLSGIPSNDPRHRAAEVLGVKIAKGMIEMEGGDVSGMRMSGLISLPWETRSNSGGITISVGGRVVKDRSMVEAIRRGYGSRLMKGRFPLAIIFIEMDGKDVDANVHPTKDIVKFSNEGAVLNYLESMVSRTLFSGKGRDQRRPISTVETPEDDIGSGIYLRSKEDRTPIDRSPRQVPLMEDEIRPQDTTPGPWNEVPSIDGMDKLPPGLPTGPGKKRIRIIGQLDRSYILCEIGPDLLLIDQHAAHERIRLEMLKKEHWDDKVIVQELLEPVQIELDAISSENLKRIDRDLKDLGFRFETFGTDMITVRGLPRFLGRTEGHEVLRDMITGNEHHEGCSYPDESFRIELPIKERLIALTACRGAIKAHESLSLKEMEDLIEDLLKCEIPLHCAHGRPTMVRLPLKVLEKWFKRVL